jgi:hypothetical protein
MHKLALSFKFLSTTWMIEVRLLVWISLRRKDFSFSSSRPDLIKWVPTVPSQGINRPKHEADHSASFHCRVFLPGSLHDIMICLRTMTTILLLHCFLHCFSNYIFMRNWKYVFKDPLWKSSCACLQCKDNFSTVPMHLGVKAIERKEEECHSKSALSGGERPVLRFEPLITGERPLVQHG